MKSFIQNTCRSFSEEKPMSFIKFSKDTHTHTSKQQVKNPCSIVKSLEFEDSLMYRACSRMARVTHRNSVLGYKKKKKEKEALPYHCLHQVGGQDSGYAAETAAFGERATSISY